MNWVGFPNLGIDKIEICPYLTVFGFNIYWYGIIIACGILAAIVYAFFNAEKFGIDNEKMIDVIIMGIIGGIIGARFYYVIFTWNIFKNNLLSILDLRTGGLAIYGGIIFAIFTGWIMCKWKKIRFLPMLDLAGIGFLLGQGIGRWGNFVNIEAYGGHTDLPWGMTASRINADIQPVHPTFLYESIWCLIGFLFFALFAKYRKFDGQVFIMYLIWYGFERFFVEGLRVDSLWLIPGLIRISQLLSLILFIAATIILIYMICYYMKKNPNKQYLYVNSLEWQNILRKKKEKALKGD